MNTTLNDAVTTYVDAVRDALTDLPADEVAEIVEDITEHLDQVAAEIGGDMSPADLNARLGSPANYAQELRTAAGFPPPEPPARKRRLRHWRRPLRFLVTWALRSAAAAAAIAVPVAVLVDRGSGAMFVAYAAITGVVAIGLWLLAHGPRDEPTVALGTLPDAPLIQRGYDALRGHPQGDTTVEFVTSLRPAWWVLRAWIAIQLLSGSLLDGWYALPLARFPGAPFVLVGAIVASVWWGRRTVTGRVQGWPRLAQLAGNTVLALAAPLLIVAANEPNVIYVEPDLASYAPAFYGIAHEDGSPIINLFPYDSNGQLLEGVRIYDQDGRPVDNLDWWDECGREAGMYPGGAHGNVFPRPTTDWDENGECYEAEIRSPFGPALPGAAVAEVTEDGVAEEDPHETDEAADPEESAEPTAEPTAGPAAEPTVTPTKTPESDDADESVE